MIHDHFCRCRACKPPRGPSIHMTDAIGQHIHGDLHAAQGFRAWRTRLDRGALGLIGLVSVIALCGALQACS